MSWGWKLFFAALWLTTALVVSVELHKKTQAGLAVILG